jgi:copper chaperone CopZ
MFKQVKNIDEELEEYEEGEQGEEYEETIQYEDTKLDEEGQEDEEGEKSEESSLKDYTEDAYEDEQKVTFSDMTRVSKLGVRISGKGSLQDYEKEIEKRTKSQNPDIGFREKINTICNYYIENGIISYKIKGRTIEFDENTIKEILKSVDYISNVQYKNPTAYILGFLASNGGISIEKETIKKIFNLVTDKEDEEGNKIYAKIKEGNVNPEDIIRYANLWIKIKKLMD